MGIRHRTSSTANFVWKSSTENMDPHDAIIAVRDCKIREWTDAQLTAAHADCHVELKRLMEPQSNFGGVNHEARRNDLRDALSAIRSELASRAAEKQAGERHREAMDLEEKTCGVASRTLNWTIAFGVVTSISAVIAVLAWLRPRSTQSPTPQAGPLSLPSAASNSHSIAYTQSVARPATGLPVRVIIRTNATNVIPAP